jgi:hypothetical protein
MTAVQPASGLLGKEYAGAALALGVGYVLGRRRKVRMAAALAGATAVGVVGRSARPRRRASA